MSQETVTAMFDEARIAARTEELAAAIAETCPRDVLIIGILKGAFVFVADLVRALDRAGVRPVVEFLRLRSYGLGQKSSGEVQVVGELPSNIEGRHILVVDDIQDTGRTLAVAVQLLQDKGAATVWTCALLDKPSRREVAFQADFIGFEIEDVFVVGYGIDFAERYRHLPFIGRVE